MEIKVHTVEAPPPKENKYLLHRRFDRMGRLVGDEGMEKLLDAHIMVIGVGGVGSWAAESLSRSGVGQITLVDFDDICVTNTNRQLHAQAHLIGKQKAEVMGERLSKINPQAKINVVPKFYNADTHEEILKLNPDVILDCIDNVTAKCHLLDQARKRGINIISSGSAGARLDPLRIRVTDLANTAKDPLCQTVRRVLRTKYDFPLKGPFGIPCVYSLEEVREPLDLHYDGGKGFKCVCPQGQNDYHSCERRNVIYGNASFVTGAFGLTMASLTVRHLTGVTTPHKWES